MIDVEWLEILRCPFHPESSPLIVKGSLLICPVDGTGFRVLNGIPDMLPEDALKPDEVLAELALVESGKSKPAE